jgi:hypothetical protein
LLLKFTFLFYFPNFLFSIYFPPSIPTLIPLFLLPFFYPFLVTILSHISKISGLVGRRIHGSSSPSMFLCHESDRPPCYNILNHFLNFMGSQGQAFIFQVPRSPLYTQSFVIYIMTVRLVVGTEPLNISFLLCTNPTDHFETLGLFFIIHNRGFAGSQKDPCSKLLLFVPSIFMFFPICINCGLMLIIDYASSQKIVINSEGIQDIFH